MERGGTLTKPIEPLDLNVIFDEWDRLCDFSVVEGMTHLEAWHNNGYQETITTSLMDHAEASGYDSSSLMAGIAIGWAARDIAAAIEKDSA